MQPLEGGNGEQEPTWQLPPGHSESKLQLGGTIEQEPIRQLPEPHCESSVQLLLEESGNGEQWPNWQLLLVQSELKVQASGSFATVLVGLAAVFAAAQPTAMSSITTTNMRP